MAEKIYGFFTKGDEEGTYDVTVVLPSYIAEFFCVDSQWDLVMDAEEDLRATAIEMIEEETAGDMEDVLYDTFCTYLEDEKNWDGEIEEGEIFEGIEAVVRFWDSVRLGQRLH